MQAAWQLVALWGVMVGLGSGAMALVLGAMVATRWFVRRRGLITGIFAASTATGQLVFLPLQAALVETSGWRPAVLLAACVARSTCTVPAPVTGELVISITDVSEATPTDVTEPPPPPPPPLLSATQPAAVPMPPVKRQRSPLEVS